MKKWRRRGGAGPAPYGLFHCNALFIEGGLVDVTWEWAGADPDLFLVFFSNDGGFNFEGVIGNPFAGTEREAFWDAAGNEGILIQWLINAKVGGNTVSVCHPPATAIPP